jgi:hypothetical protein
MQAGDDSGALALRNDASLATELCGALLVALASHLAQVNAPAAPPPHRRLHAAQAPPRLQELLPRIADALRQLLSACGESCGAILAAGLAAEHSAATAAAATPPDPLVFCTAAAALADDPRAFRAVAADYSLLARATAPPPREEMQSPVFLH